MLLERALFNPLTPAIVLIVAGLSFGMLWWFPGGILAYGAATGCAILALMSWVGIYRTSSSYLGLLIDLTREKERRERALLRDELADLEVPQGIQQLDLLENKYQDVVSVLKARFSKDELTYSRYMQGASDLYKGAVRNLDEVTVALKSIRSTDAEALKGQIGALSNASDANQAEIDAKRKRLSIYERQQEKARELLTINEEALTLMAQMASGWADAKLTDDADNRDLFDQMSRLIERIDRYKA